MAVLRRIDDFPEHLAMIGLIATDWSSLEGALAFLFWDLIGDANKGSAIYYSLGSLNARCDLMRALAGQVTNEPMKKELLRVLDKVRRVAKERNFVVHGQWGLERDGQPTDKLFVQVETPANATPLRRETYTVRELRRIADGIRDLETEVQMLHWLLPYKDSPPAHWKLAHLNEMRSRSKRFAELMELFFPGLPAEIVFEEPKWPSDIDPVPGRVGRTG